MVIDGTSESGPSPSDATLRLRFEISSDREDDLTEILSRHKTMGASLGTGFGETVNVEVFFGLDDDRRIPDFVQSLSTIGVESSEVDRQEAEDWLSSYRDHVRPFSVGESWWIDPHPHAPTPAPEGMSRLVVEPRMAFGTGSHQSTALMLMELESCPPKGLKVLDVGTGSGILALAAERLDAQWAVGFDLDVEAVMVARQIKRDQDFPCAPAYFAGVRQAIGSAAFDLILCNMISEHFLPMAGSLKEILSTGGSMIFSGILESEADDVSRALQSVGFRMVSTRAMDEWVAMRMVHAD